jgi:hypothetical protein
MARQGKGEFFGTDAAAVINDSDSTNAASFKSDFN